MKRLIATIVLILTAVFAASAVEVYDVNRNWKFFTYTESNSIPVNLPHTWNNDALSGRGDYYRGVGNYLRYIDINNAWRGKRLFLRFGGANAVTDLLIGGSHVGQHRGGSNGFTFEITPYVEFGKPNLFWIMINNSQMIDILPTAGADNAYGGIFREIELIVTEQVAISPLYNGADGIMINYTEITDQSATGNVVMRVLSTKQKSDISGAVSIVDQSGGEVAHGVARAKVENGETLITIPFRINNPRLWNGREDPYLYRFHLTLTDGNEVCDEREVRSGVRTVSVDADGLKLNGRRIDVRGVVLHRDRSLVGTAMTAAQIREDIDIIDEMGANMIRVAGGSHAGEFYDQCDQRGIMVFNDLPLMGATELLNKGYYNTRDFRLNGSNQLNEMICQLYNHPSVVAWNLFSELEIRGENPVNYIADLNAQAKKLDPSRLTSGYSNQDGPINFITDLIVWAHTLGWVDGMVDDIKLWCSQMHTQGEWSYLRSAVGVKCGGSVMHQTDTLAKPVAPSNWHPERWQTHYHQTYTAAVAPDSLFWGEVVDCMFDFGSALYTYGDGVGVCDYGVVTFDRQIRKDAFYFYKANWNTEQPFVYIAERRWKRRPHPVQNFKIFSNRKEVILSVNGVPVDTVATVQGTALFEKVTLNTGTNNVEVRSSDGCYDSAQFEVPRSYLRSL